MAISEALQTFLDYSGTRYLHSTHPQAYTAREVARAEELPPHQIAKTIVFYGDNGFGMAVLPGDAYANLQELRDLLGLSTIRLASEEELAQLFPDTEVGAMPPFGNLYGLPVFVDGDLAEEHMITFNAGTHRDAVHMRFADFTSLVGPSITYFSREG
jgi:Ala-tRNA(Pro) deacylase